MSLLNNPEKTASSQNPSLTGKSKITHESAPFSDKLREIQSLIGALLPAEKQGEVLQHLQELHEIYLADTHRDRLKLERNEEGEGRRRSEKVILEVREGNRLTNEVKIEAQTRLKSPERKTEEKKFVKFDPKKVKGEVTTGLANILKNG